MRSTTFIAPVRLNPSEAEPHLRLGFALSVTEQYDPADESFERGAATNPNMAKQYSHFQEESKSKRSDY